MNFNKKIIKYTKKSKHQKKVNIVYENKNHKMSRIKENHNSHLK